jgi:Rrf2 family iron-sulfur cluster assembly transcriptional regulator
VLSKTARYALRILGYLSERPGEWTQGDSIAAATGVPANYLSKILNQLRKQQVVDSQKGWGGGFTIAEHAGRVPILEVVELFDGKRPEKECVFDLALCDSEKPCPLHEYWIGISNQFEEMLRQVTISQLGSADFALRFPRRPRATAGKRSH